MKIARFEQELDTSKVNVNDETMVDNNKYTNI